MVNLLRKKIQKQEEASMSKNQTTPQHDDNAMIRRLYVGIELSLKEWKLALSDGQARRPRVVTVPAKDWERLDREIEKAKERLGLDGETEVWSCYEAGREAFWIHRELEERGIRSHVIDAASIEVPRGKRRKKTDRLDARQEVRQLIRYGQGEENALRVVRVPTREAEDARHLTRELEVLKEERKSHRLRIQSLLFTQGIDLAVRQDFLEKLAEAKGADGRPVPEKLLGRLKREYQRLELVESEIGELEKAEKALLESGRSEAGQKARRLGLLRGIGEHGACVLSLECFGWRKFENRREVGGALGFVPSPYNSGEEERDLPVGPGGIKRLRPLAIQLAWSWLRYQPFSKLTRWYQKRFASGSKRVRRIGIVALARRLMVALWRYLEHGIVPQGAQLKTV